MKAMVLKAFNEQMYPEDTEDPTPEEQEETREGQLEATRWDQ